MKLRPATTIQRLSAKFIDAFVGAAVYLGVLAFTKSDYFAVAIGWLVFALGDTIGSVGKAMVGIRSVNAQTGGAVGAGQSLLRNAVFLPSLVRAELRSAHDLRLETAITAATVVATLVMVLETRWMVLRRDQRRLGDALGDTQVVLR